MTKCRCMMAASLFFVCLFVFSSFDNSFVFVLFALLLFFLSSYFFFHSWNETSTAIINANY